jgi:hypothetical protein
MLPLLLWRRSSALGHACLRMRLLADAPKTSMAALSSAITNSNNATSLKISVAEELLSKLSDPTILHTAAYIGGEWRLATSHATFQVQPQAPHGRITPCWAGRARRPR